MSKVIYFLRIVLPLALVAGIAEAQGNIRLNNYIGYHMYNTVINLAVTHVDDALIMVLVGCAIWLVLKLRRWAGAFFGTLISLALSSVVVFACIRMPRMGSYLDSLAVALIKTAHSPWNMTLFRETLRTSLIPVITPVTAALIFSAAYAARGRVDSESKSGRMAKVQWVRPVSNGLISILMLVFVVLHLIYGFRHTETVVALKDKPNIILIQIDTTRADHLGCYGYNRNTSPNIDMLAKQSARFSQAHSQAPWTLWSVSSYMTSLYPETLGIGLIPGEEKTFGRLNERYLTLAETLRDAGYSTVSASANNFFSPEQNNMQGFDSTYVLPQDPKATQSPEILSFAKHWLGENKSRKFFMYLLFMDPHQEYLQHPEFPFASPSYKGLYSQHCLIGNDPDVSKFVGSHPDEIKQAIALYDSEIAYNDRSIGQLMSFLKSQGLYDNTLIVLTADHGEGFGEHSIAGIPSFTHSNTLYEELLRVPLIVKSPGQHKGHVVDGAFSLLNLFPSILRSIGGNVPEQVFGRAMDFSTLDLSADEAMFSATDSGFKIRCTTRYPYKYILNTNTNEAELYNLAVDPGEKHDISKSEPGIAQSLRKSLTEHMNEMAAHSNPSPEKADISESRKLGFKSLGYLQ